MAPKIITPLLAGFLLLAVSATGSGTDIVAQTAGDEPQPPPPPAQELILGERWSTPMWDLEVYDVFAAPSPGAAGSTEIRIVMSLRNTGASPLPYSQIAFAATPGYPRLSLIDGSGTEHGYRLLRPRHTAVPGSAVLSILPGLTGRWTVGFTVPAAFDDELTLVTRDSSGAAARWDLSTTTLPQGWEPPDGAGRLGFGQAMDWGGLAITPVDHGSLLCGRPTFQHVTQIYTLVFDVENGSSAPIEWPGVRAPRESVIAQWADGATAGSTIETFVGTETLQKLASDLAIVPPGASAQRAFMFAVPRDGRLGIVSDSPQGALLRPPGGDPVWLDFDVPGSAPINPAFCDDGQFDFAIPYAFAPSVDFQVANVALPGDPASQDREAQELLTQALIVAGRFHRLAGDTYKGATAEGLEVIWEGVDFVSGLGNAATGVVGFDAPSDTQIVLVTKSASGRFFCASSDLGKPSIFGDADNFATIEVQCLAAAESQEGA